MLGRKWDWEQFKKDTNVKGASRGSNMREVDNALKSYWDCARKAQDGAAPIYTLFGLLKACNSWLKLKKDKNIGGGNKAHFQTRWDKVKDLGDAAMTEANLLLGAYDDPNTSAAGWDYERKKLRQTTNNQAGTTQALSGGYAKEREQWTKGKKATNPVSATTLHEVVGMLVPGVDGMSFNQGLSDKLGGSKVLRKNFDSMTVKDFQAIDKIMGKIEKDGSVGDLSRQVLFLRKADRLQHMAMPQGGLLVKSDGANWNIPGFDEAYAMDSYGNLFIGQASLATRAVRLNHSSLLGGDEVICAGTLKIANGVLTKFNNNSGHYKPTGVHLFHALNALAADNVDLTQVECTVVIDAAHGFGDLTAQQVIAANGVFSQPHANYY